MAPDHRARGGDTLKLVLAWDFVGVRWYGGGNADLVNCSRRFAQAKQRCRGFEILGTVGVEERVDRVVGERYRRKPMARGPLIDLANAFLVYCTAQIFAQPHRP